MATITAEPGNRVKILTSDRRPDENIYVVEQIKRSVAFLTCEDTGRQIKVHKTRISEVLMKEEEMSNVTATVDSEVETLEAVKAKPKTKRARTSKELPKPLDFDELLDQDMEIWTRTGLNFDVPGMKVAAHCIIDPNGSSFRTFNTYNGSIGRSGKLPDWKPFTEKNTLEKKRANLEKKGYVLHTDLDPENFSF